MLGNKFLNSISGLNSTVRFLGIALGVSILSNLVLSVSVLSKEPIVVLRTPYQANELVINHDAANGDFKKSWGLYASMVLGNVNPGSSGLILDGLEVLMTPKTYKEMRGIVAAQANEIKREQVTLEFSPRQVYFEQETGLVFITGTQTRRGATGEPEKSTRTYEIDIRVDNFRPQIHRISVYNGGPLSKAAKDALKAKEAAEKEKSE
jgi:conjugal transfer pilus assembly protein TraE